MVPGRRVQLTGRVRSAAMRSTPVWAALPLLAVAGCATPPPPLGEGLHGPIEAVRAGFDRRVTTQFPVGSDEALLHAELVRQKFAIVRDKDAPFSFRATYRSGGIVCLESWSIRWSEYAGKIADIEARWGETCL
jgi:hypothetical protein